ncbi:metal-dependent phosphohydrolase [Candidatus Bathyarchaeota archaeon]|nr:MAG: metal-dependent phosphohydrolase [Candidatus Bathyarchaeota archaeon]
MIEKENQIWEKAQQYLKKGRSTDLEHTKRAVDYGKYLLQYENGNPSIVIPCLYLHDIGWSMTEEFSPEGIPNIDLHMKYGSELAEKILKEINYPSEESKKIVFIISIHDNPEKVFALNDIDATLVVEADRLDRFGIPAIERYKKMRPDKPLSEVIKKNEKGLDKWFKTNTGKKLARRLFSEMSKNGGEIAKHF